MHAEPFVEVAAGGDHSIARRSDCAVLAWGANVFGQYWSRDPGDAFGQAIAIDASHAKALQWRGEVRVLLGRLDAAVLDLTRALELLDTVEIEDLPEGRDAMRIRVLFQRAGALDALGRHDEARADREAARADPGRQPAELTPGASGR